MLCVAKRSILAHAFLEPKGNYPEESKHTWQILIAHAHGSLGWRGDLLWRYLVLGSVREYIAPSKTAVGQARGIKRRDGSRTLTWGELRSLVADACSQGSQDALLAVTKLKALRA